MRSRSLCVCVISWDFSSHDFIGHPANWFPNASDLICTWFLSGSILSRVLWILVKAFEWNWVFSPSDTHGNEAKCFSPVILLHHMAQGTSHPNAIHPCSFMINRVSIQMVYHEDSCCTIVTYFIGFSCKGRDFARIWSQSLRNVHQVLVWIVFVLETSWNICYFSFVGLNLPKGAELTAMSCLFLMIFSLVPVKIPQCLCYNVSHYSSTKSHLILVSARCIGRPRLGCFYTVFSHPDAQNGAEKT